MGEMMNYIFRSLEKSEKRLNVVARTLRNQRQFNNNITIFATVATVNLIMGNMEMRKQSAKIKKLEREIEELKRSEKE